MWPGNPGLSSALINRLLPNLWLLCLSLGWTKKLMVRKLEDDLDWALTRTLPLSSKILFDSFLLRQSIWQWPFQLPTGKDVPVYPWTIRPRVDGKLCGRLLQESSCREHPSSKVAFVSPRSTFQFLMRLPHNFLFQRWPCPAVCGLFEGISSSCWQRPGLPGNLHLTQLHLGLVFYTSCVFSQILLLLAFLWLMKGEEERPRRSKKDKKEKREAK